MVDYNNGIDITIYPPVIYKSHWYSLIPSISNGNLFISFSIDKNMIDLQEIKSNSILFKPSMIFSSLILFNFALFQSVSNLDEKYNDLIGIIWQSSNIQIDIAYFNSTTSIFESTLNVILNKGFYIWYFVNYNTTLIYVWGESQRNNIRE